MSNVKENTWSDSLSTLDVDGRKLVFLFPQSNLNDGGHLAQEKFFTLASRFYQSEKVSYAKREQSLPYLDDLLSLPASCDESVYCIHYGPHINKLVKRLRGRRIVYFAHSTGWGFNLPKGIPVISVSKHSQAYWGSRAATNPGYCLPNIISPEFNVAEKNNSQHQRDVDVLIVKRKMSKYLLETLVPKLQQHCKVKLIDHWVDDLAAELKKAKVFLYDSAEYWAAKGVSEGFGLPPLEAAACGCIVFSSINDALSDYLTPGVNCSQLAVADVDYDVQRIRAAINNWQLPAIEEDRAADFRECRIGSAMQTIMNEVFVFFAHNDKRAARSSLSDRYGLFINSANRLLAG